MMKCLDMRAYERSLVPDRLMDGRVKPGHDGRIRAMTVE
jgi:hypothetical protein